MGTGIEWTDETWNPVTGCTKVSPGCDHCYAEKITERFSGKGSFAEIVLHPDRLMKPLHWKKPRRVFVNSMSDLFHDEVPDEFIARVFMVMEVAIDHTFQVLTKRPGRMASLLNRWAARWASDPEMPTDIPSVPLRNVWLGTSVENQRWADVRIPKLLETPAAVRFLSVEPLLGPVDLDEPWPGTAHRSDYVNQLDWIIVGGESGPGARPMHPDWARSLRDQCVAAGVPFFFKQWGAWYPTANVADDGRVAFVDPDGQARDASIALPALGAQLMARVDKKGAGRELDGRTWNEMPAVEPALTA